MNNLTKKQVDFLKAEVVQNKVKPPVDYSKLTSDEMDRLQEMCNVIEEIEAVSHDPISQRGSTAADISDILYKM